ncbi:hypothetical protein [Streptomyces sp. NPDC020742]|uniref:hypothetical protein n=1 Tax=unclassified Streptomyces TaxID=2593676 RepID=UPI0033C72EAB
MNRALRFATVGVIAASLLAGGSAAAFAAPQDLHTARPAAATAPAAASLTAKASVTTVKAWEQFRISGAAKGIAAGNKITVQQKQGTKWVSLPAQAPINKSGAYSVRVKLGIKGVNHLRIASGSTLSPQVTVTVR